MYAATISESRTDAQALAEYNRHRRALNGWRVNGYLCFDKPGLRIEFYNGRWTLYRNEMIKRTPLFSSSYLVAVIDAAKGI